MRFPYPRSFLGLFVGGVVLVIVPLLAALAAGALYMDRLTSAGQDALGRAVEATQATRRIADLLRELERTARQSLILGEETLPSHYAARRQELAATVGRLVDLPFDGDQRAKLAELMSIEREVHDRLEQRGASAAELTAVVARFGDAARLASQLIERSDALIERESREMAATARQAHRVLFWLAAATVPVALLVIWTFATLLARPVRALDAAIGAIGAGRLGAPVQVSGPRDLQNLGARLEWLRRQLLDLEEQKNRFLRQVAHALKTPLSAVRESIALLGERGEQRSPTERELLDILKRNALELQRRVEDVLELGEADFRRLTLNVGRVDLEKLIAGVCEGHELAARARGLHIQLDLAQGARELQADPDKLRVIVDNLLSNAIKHAPTGSTVELFTRPEKSAVVIGIRDEGRGIAPQDRERVFDPFYQGAIAGAGAVKGSGVGLAIVREYALAHGGRAWVADDTRGGAQVCVVLPSTRAGVSE